MNKILKERIADRSKYHCSCGGKAIKISKNSVKIFFCNGCRMIKSLEFENKLVDLQPFIDESNSLLAQIEAELHKFENLIS